MKVFFFIQSSLLKGTLLQLVSIVNTSRLSLFDMLLQLGPSVLLGPVITLLPSTDLFSGT